MCLSLKNLETFLSLMVQVVPELAECLGVDPLLPDIEKAAQKIAKKLLLYEYSTE